MVNNYSNMYMYLIKYFLFLGIVKTHNLAFIECETLQAVFSKDMSPNRLTAQAKYVF